MFAPSQATELIANGVFNHEDKLSTTQCYMFLWSYPQYDASNLNGTLRAVKAFIVRTRVDAFQRAADCALSVCIYNESHDT